MREIDIRAPEKLTFPLKRHIRKAQFFAKDAQTGILILKNRNSL
jgi:hypothetical protein